MKKLEIVINGFREKLENIYFQAISGLRIFPKWGSMSIYSHYDALARKLEKNNQQFSRKIEKHRFYGIFGPFGQHF